MNLSLLARIPRRDGVPAARSGAARHPPRTSWAARLATIAASAGGIVLLVAVLSGCASAPPSPYVADSKPTIPDSLKEGDALQIVFPGATNLNTLQRIPLDGTITLQFAGQVKAAGRTPQELQNDILASVGSSLQLKEVTVTVVSSSAAVYITGAVLRPGKLVLERPMTALEAIMESGGFDPTRAKMDRVVVVRYEQGKQFNYHLDLKRVLQGREATPFYLQPFDIVHVPTKIFNL